MAAITFTPGQVVPVADFSALGQQHGGDKSQQTRPPTAQELAAAQAEARAAAPLGDDEAPDPQDPRTWYIKYETNPIHRYHFADGSYVEARTAPNGTDYQIVEYHPSATFTQAQTKAAAADPANQTPAQKNEEVLNQQRARNAALSADQDPRYETDEARAARADARIKEQGAQAQKDQQGVAVGSKQSTDGQGKTVKTTTYRRPDGTTYETSEEVQAAPEKPVVAPGVAGQPAVQYVPDPDHPGQVKAVPITGAPTPPPEQVTLPSNQKWDVRRNADGTYTTVKNPNYVTPSQIVKDPNTGKYIQVTEDENGKPVILPVDDKTAIKPADLPVLQTRFGEIAQGLGQLAADLNARAARGEITDEQRTKAFAAAHAQAETQVSEINSILDNSRAIWSGQITQRGQSLGETQSRRSFASSAADRAIATGSAIAQSAGPGHGQAIARGVQALLGMQQKYAEGMGGFRESPEIGLPPALEQARGIGLPGYAMPSSAGASLTSQAGGPNLPQTSPNLPQTSPSGPVGRGPGVPSGAAVSSINAASQAQSRSAFGALGVPPLPSAPTPPPTGAAAPPSPFPAGSGISNTTDAGGVPRQYTPASASTPPPPPPPSPTASMGSALSAGQGYAGAPAAAGGLGTFDPMQAAQAMLGSNPDPVWANAVRQALLAHQQQGYGYQG